MAEVSGRTAMDDLLRRAAAMQRLAVERALADLDVTPAQYAVLSVIAETPGLSNADIARIERLTPQTMSVIIANMERKRVVVRRARIRAAAARGVSRAPSRPRAAPVRGDAAGRGTFGGGVADPAGRGRGLTFA